MGVSDVDVRAALANERRAWPIAALLGADPALQPALSSAATMSVR